MTTYAFLDQGSTCSILSKDMALALKIPLRSPKVITLRGTNFNTACSQYVHEADLEIADTSSSVKYPWQTVFVMENPQIPKLSIYRSHVSASYKHLNGINFPNLKTCDVTALLGLDVFDLIVGKTSYQALQTRLRQFNVCWAGFSRGIVCLPVQQHPTKRKQMTLTFLTIVSVGSPHSSIKFPIGGNGIARNPEGEGHRYHWQSQGSENVRVHMQ